MATEKSSFPYSKALFELAQDSKNLDSIKNDVSYIQEVLHVSIEFKDIIKEINDTVLYEDKYTDDMYEKSKELTMKLPNQDLAYKYMKPIIIKNKS